MKLSKLIFLILVLSLLVGCNSIGDSDSSGNSVASANGLPPDPGEAGKATLQGIDSDNDGVRDDVQIAIYERYPDNQSNRTVLTQEAIALQEALIAGDSSNNPAITEASELVLTAVDSMHERVEDPTSEIGFIELMIVNTPARSEAYIKFNEALSNQFFGGDSGNSSLSYAADDETNPCVYGDKTVIYYVNGVWNSLAQAREGRNAIQTAYQQSLASQYPEQDFEFKIAYNYSAGKVRDLIEVIGQKLNEINDSEANQLTPAQYYLLYMTAKDFNEDVPVVARPIATAIEEYLAGRLTNSIDAAAHIQLYKTDLQEGRRVLLVAHSQGNMFANQAIMALMSSYGNSIGMIGVASPAAYIYNGSTYYTAHDDRVIDALRLLHPVLPSNIDNDPGLFNDPRDISNHEFVRSYFAVGLSSRTRIDADVNNYMASLEFPGAQLGSGAITITLEWGNQPDVDLHVTEPNGTHVYYANLQGYSGYLDLDDVDGLGPEHYYVSCETLETGNYYVGVNYYRGEAPETARIQISTGNGNTRTFTQTLTSAVGSAGNNSPIHIATITVSKNQNGKYVYEIR